LLFHLGFGGVGSLRATALKLFLKEPAKAIILFQQFIYTMKRKIALLAYGFLLISVWSLCFAIKDKTNSYTAAMGLAFTFFSIYFLQKEFDFRLSFSDKLTVAALPILYLLSTYFVLYEKGTFDTPTYNFVNLYQILFYLHLINPLAIATLVLFLALTKLRDVSKPVNCFIFITITLFYSYFFYDHWKVIWFKSLMENFGSEESKTADNEMADEYKIDSSKKISNFKFINQSLDTIKIPTSSGRYILLETWNENCFPCIKAMNELPDFYRTIKDKVDVYYVYENESARVRRNFNKIFTFNGISEKSKIIIDINQELYKAINMSGFPYFLLFDPSGTPIYRFRGYPGKASLSENILERVK